ncbi:hypothetical protein FVE85_5629 [Porphyridium purpureum]|nr:hypothetical protein FVE85_5629 [Porphyridium purpureum]|eukprot:POR4874..scf295_1
MPTSTTSGISMSSVAVTAARARAFHPLFAPLGPGAFIRRAVAPAGRAGAAIAATAGRRKIRAGTSRSAPLPWSRICRNKTSRIGASAETQAMAAGKQDVTLKVCSWNVLLPNGQAGATDNPAWFVNKYYGSRTPREIRTWEHRHELIRKRIHELDADIYALQEVAAATFEADFAFLASAGYEHVLHNKHRFRPATFWRRDQFELCGARCKDRTLLVLLRHRISNAYLFVANCHLTGGSGVENAQTRLRQIADVVGQAEKEARKMIAQLHKVPQTLKKHERSQLDMTQYELALEEFALCCMGDFNASGNTAVRHFLREACVTPEFQEPFQEGSLTSKEKHHAFGPLTDIYEDWFGVQPTYVAPDLKSVYIDAETQGPSALFGRCVRHIFEKYTGGGDRMTSDQLLAFVRFVNDGNMRGGILRAYNALVATRPGRESDKFIDTTISADDLIELCFSEVVAGMLWSLRYDFEMCGAPDIVRPDVFAENLDHIFVSSHLQPISCSDTLSQTERAAIFERGEFVPNEWHPSDHFPISGVLCWVRGARPGKVEYVPTSL